MKKLNEGFTFIELLVVLTIIGIVFAAGIASYSVITVKSRDTRRKADLEAIRQSLEMCRSLTGTYPASIADNITCGTNVLMTKTPIDPKPCPVATSGLYLYLATSDTAYTLTAPCMELDATYKVTNP